MKFRNLAAATAAVMLTLGTLPARAEITLNLKDADISTLIATVSEVTGKNFIVDARVKGKVTVVSASPMSSDGLYETFLAVLAVNGFAAIPAGDTIKIIPEATAKQEGSGVYGSSSRLPIDEVVTHVYQLQNINAAQLVPILRVLVPQWGHLAAYQPNNSLIITDRASNVERIGRLIQQMDQAGDREIEFVRLQYAAASEIVRILTAMTQQDKQSDPTSQPATIIADERSNSILIGGDKAARQKFIDIVRQLDIQLEDDGATQVVYLRHASAENLAPILEGYAQQVREVDNGSGAAAGGGAAAPAAAGRSGGGTVDGARVLADPDTNALIITANPKAMRQIRDVIAQLDIRRAQVLVEAIVAEVSANKSSQIGVDWAVFNGDRIAAAGILDPGTLSALTAAAASGNPESALGAIGQGINIIGGRDGGDNGTTFGLLLKALKGDGDTNVLSTPTLVTLDNEEAKFSVGQEVPYQTGSFTNTGSVSGSVNPFQTIERKDVGLTLSVTPQISGESETIKLKLDLEVSGIASGTAGSANLITNKRTLTNVVGVENGQVLVVAGLIDDQINDQQRGVPFLSDIPLLGALFKYRSIDKTKQNLMLFIRPSILRKSADGDYYTRKKYDAVRQAQIDAATGAASLIGGQRPILRRLEDWATRPDSDAPAAAVEDAASAPAAPVAPTPAAD
ncbi:type II secretion system secretin GspD [Sinimarinibacterium flocculans]|uniref:General secretion pathway protein D n=2 Tax=Sinimarinibacterium flocculans TaxID=985250 RepID=A0A318E9X4_9GAMM|nr:type II secretion system secretin GspD [Sinimarinibacterium flocculans]PXV66189.1 general secretion pathway protein D [Sinimarinibacterium flocculans]